MNSSDLLPPIPPVLEDAKSKQKSRIYLVSGLVGGSVALITSLLVPFVIVNLPPAGDDYFSPPDDLPTLIASVSESVVRIECALAEGVNYGIGFALDV